MNSDVSYEVSYDRNCETKNDEKLNRHSELKAYLYFSALIKPKNSSRFIPGPESSSRAKNRTWSEYWYKICMCHKYADRNNRWDSQTYRKRKTWPFIAMRSSALSLYSRQTMSFSLHSPDHLLCISNVNQKAFTNNRLECGSL